MNGRYRLCLVRNSMRYDTRIDGIRWTCCGEMMNENGCMDLKSP